MSNGAGESAPFAVEKLARKLSSHLRTCVTREELPVGLKKLYNGVIEMLNIYIGVFEKIKETLENMGSNVATGQEDAQIGLEDSCELENVKNVLRELLSRASNIAKSSLLDKIALLSVYYTQFIDVLNATIETMENEKNALGGKVDLYQCDVCGYISVRERPIRCPVCNETGKNFKVL